MSSRGRQHNKKHALLLIPPGDCSMPVRPSLLYSSRVKRLLNRWPGKERFGIYRFLPVFFVLGAALEFSMINWHVGETNFYRVFKRRQAQKLAQAALEREEFEK